MEIRYEDITKDMLGTKRQRPMYLSKFTQFRSSLDMRTYPKDPHAYTKHFLVEIDSWINQHRHAKYKNLEGMQYRDAILGTTHQLDELHMLHGNNIRVLPGEYKYHRRLTNFKVNEIKHYLELKHGDVFVVSYPSCITTGTHVDFDKLLDHCAEQKVPVHIDGAWFGQCRRFYFDVSHPAVSSLSVSISKAYGMGSQRIGIRYAKERPIGPISIMNDFDYCNVSDMWIGVEMMKHYGPDYWWNYYGHLYTKVCKDFSLEESNSIHVAWSADEHGRKHYVGIRTPLRFLIEGVFDQRGTDNGLNEIEKAERK